MTNGTCSVNINSLIIYVFLFTLVRAHVHIMCFSEHHRNFFSLVPDERVWHLFSEFLVKNLNFSRKVLGSSLFRFFRKKQ